MLPRQLDIASCFPTPSLADWRALVEEDLQGASFDRKLVSRLYEGIEVKPLYTAVDAPGADPSGFSGMPPFTRSSRPLGSSVSGWDIRQERAEPSPALLNGAILEDLRNAVTSVLVRLDLAGRAGLDADDPAAGARVGADGASLSTPGDWRAAFEGVYLEMIGVGLEAGAAFVPAAAMLASLWESAGLGPERVHGAFNADPLAVLARDGRLPVPLPEAMAQAAELAAWTSARYPHVRAIRVGTAAYHHAGATATQDLAFAIASGVEYLRAMGRAGLAVDRAAGQIVFSFAVGCQPFLAASKLRAARRLWSRVIEACGADPAAGAMVMHVRPSRRVLTRHDPWVNMLRNTVCVFAAALGGADAIGSAPFDLALGGRSALGRRVARNTQLILQEECRLHALADPAGGSWYAESLTQELAVKAWEIFQEIESRGGMAACVADGWAAEKVRAVHEARARDVATRKQPITGLSEFADPAEKPPPEPALDEDAIRSQAAAAAASHRRTSGAAGALDTLRSAPRGERVARAFDAARAGATLGEMFRALVASAAESTVAPLPVHPFGEDFDRLRDATDRYEAQCGHRPLVFLASVGTPAEHLPRTTFAQNLFRAAGFDAPAGDGYASAAAAVEAFKGSGAAIAVICSTDKAYETLVAELAPALHRAGARTVVLAGAPGAREAEFRAAGVDRFVFVRCDVVAFLTELLAEEGVR